MEAIGKYEVVKRIACGGMAEVFLVKLYGPEGFEKLFALKRILPGLVSDSEFIQRFLDEARLAAQLIHPNIVQIFELGQSEQSFFIVMEHVQGESLYNVLRNLDRAGAFMPWDIAAKIACDVLVALDYAHNYRTPEGRPLNIIHRDVSPQNIMISELGVVKLLDFGVAKAASNIHQTRADLVSGKALYMSPEHLTGRPLDRRADIFSLSVVLYEMCTGRKPFRGLSEYDISCSIISDVPERPQKLNRTLPSKLDSLIMRALDKDPEERFSDAKQMFDSLTSVVSEQGRPVDNFSLAGFVKKAATLEPAHGSKPRPAAGHPFAARRAEAAAERAAEQQESLPPTRADTPAARSRHAGQQEPLMARYRHFLLAAGVAVAAVLAVLAALSLFRAGNKDASPRAQAFQLPLSSLDISAEVESLASQQPLKATEARPKPATATPAALDRKTAAALDPKTKVGHKKASSVKPPRKKKPDRTAAAAKSVATGKLTVDSTPQTEVRIDGKLVSLTPLRNHEMPVGEYEVSLDSREHDVHDMVKVKVGSGPAFVYKKTFRQAAVLLQVNPQADVYLGSRLVGKSGSPIKLYEGRHKLRLVNDAAGLDRQVEALVEPGKTTQFTFDFSAR